MASEMYYKCSEGHKTGLAKRMFHALRDFSESKPVSNCPVCGSPGGLYRLSTLASERARQSAKYCMHFSLASLCRGKQRGNGSISIHFLWPWSTRTGKAKPSGCLIGTL